jgi:hypothetical protein
MSGDVSGVSGAFVDPLKLKPATVGLGTVHWLKTKKYFAIRPNSPLDALLQLPAPPQAEVDGKELLKLGIPAQPDPNARVNGKGRIYLDALLLAAQPQARLEVSELGPAGKNGVSMDYVLGHGKAALVEVAATGLSFSPAIPYNDLLRPLARHFTNAALDVPRLNLWGSQLKAIVELYGAKTSLPKATAEKYLTVGAKLPAAQATALLGELLTAELLVANGDALELHPTLKAYVDRTSTGVMAELRVTPYDAEGKLGDRRELRFFGKPDDRISVLSAYGALLKSQTPKPSETVMVSISAVPKELMLSELEAFLGIA